MESLTSAPTSAQDVTRPGMILGTVPYMPPEQLQGEEASARGDIFSFGAVLYEMATARKAFGGQSPVSIMSAILTSEPPPVSAVAPASPPSLDRLIRICLAKDPDDRWQTARDVELNLRAIQDDSSASVPGPSALSPRPVRLVALDAGRRAGRRRHGPRPSRGRARNPAPRAIRFLVPPPPDSTFFSSVEAPLFSLSPDGSQLAFVAASSKGRKIWLRPLSALEARALPGTEGANSVYWSPDGRSIAFFAGGKLKRLDLSGGAAVAICDVSSGIGLTGSWGGDEILFASVQGGAILRVPASGGRPAEIIRADAAQGEWRVVWPTFLPDGRRFLYSSLLRNGEGRLMLAEPGKSPRVVMPLTSIAQYVEPGYLLFVRDGVLLAQRFDQGRGVPRGEPFSVAGHVRYFLSTGWGSFAASSSGGALAYQSNEDVRRMVWFDRTGRELGTAGQAGVFLSVAIAPDGRRVLFDSARPGIGTWDVWSFDVARGVESRITSDQDTEVFPVWSRDGSNAVYSAVRGSSPRLFRRNLATGREEALLPEGSFQTASDVSPDGKTLLYQQRTEGGPFGVWTISLSGPANPAPVQQNQFFNAGARFSPDGRYIAFVSNESGRFEAYVTPFPGPGERLRVSAGGAQQVRWSRTGEILYLSSDQRVMSVPVRTAPSLDVGSPTPLFTIPGKKSWIGFDVTPDGSKLLAIVPDVVADELPLTIVVNWTAEAGK